MGRFATAGGRQTAPLLRVNHSNAAPQPGDTTMTRTTRTTTDLRQAIAYVRVSPAGQVEDGVSLAAQKAKIVAWCDVLGYELVQTYADEGISGYRVDKRPGLQAAPDAVCTAG